MSVDPPAAMQITPDQARIYLKEGLGHDQMVATRVLITPELAGEFLDHNSSNRPLRANKVNELRATIERSEWQLTHQGVAVRPTGVLHDGQHRLAAVRNSGHTIEMFVWWNVPADTMDTIDTGIKRTAVDAFAMAGITNPQAVSAGARLLYRYRYEKWGNETITNREVMEIYQDEPDLASHLADAARMAREVGLSPAMSLVCLYLTRRATVPATTDRERFIDQVIEGEDIRRGMPAFHLRKQVRNRLLSKQKLPQRMGVGLYAKAWKTYVQDSSVEMIRFADGDPMVDIENPLTRSKSSR